jgi:Vacuolar protein sorting-associated protein 62
MNKKTLVITLCISLFFIGTSFIGIVSAADKELAEQYAPVLYFAHDEKCYPVDVSYALNNSYLFEVGNPTPISTSPTKEMLANYTTDAFYLDNQRGTVAVGDDGIENDYQSKMNTLGFKVYAHVDTTENVIQYWFFYAFNGGNLNRHEGDWEMIQVLLSGGQPLKVMYSQHYSGQSALWRQVDKDGNHVKVYVARGSHANYIKPYSGKIGVASDDVADNGKVLQPTDYTVEVLDIQPWLNFAGHWGFYGSNQSQASEAAILGEAGPNGPKFREGGTSTMWQPLAWASSLPVANDYLFILEWLVYNFVILFVLITVLSLLLFVYFIYRRNKKCGLGPRIFSLLYIDGSNTKSIGNILCIVALLIALLGLFFPWYTITANVSIPSYPATGTFSALSVDGLNGIQIRLPNQSGPVPLGTFAVPFYLLIGIGLVFVILSTIGVSHSKKLGKKYLYRGARLLVPFILILVFVLAIANIVPLLTPVSIKGDTNVQSAMNAVSAAPFSGQYTIQITNVEGGGTVNLQWGFGVGAYLLLFAGIILMLAGLIEMTAHAEFFDEKLPPIPEKRKDKKRKEPEEEKK